MLNETLGLNDDVRKISKVIYSEIDNTTEKGTYEIEIPFDNSFDINKVVVDIEKTKGRLGAFSPYLTRKINGKWSIKIYLDYQNIQRSTIAHELTHAIQYILRGEKYDQKHVLSFDDHQLKMISRIHKIEDTFFRDLSYRLYKLSNQEIDAQIAGGVYQTLETGVVGFSLRGDLVLCKSSLNYDIFEEIKNHELTTDIVYKFIKSFYKHLESYNDPKNFKDFIKRFITIFLHDMVIKRGKQIPDDKIKIELLRCQKYIRKQSQDYRRKIFKVSALSKGRTISNKEEALEYFSDMEFDDMELVNGIIDKWEKEGYPKNRFE